VAVLKLTRSVTYKAHIVPICLPYKDAAVREGSAATVAGWGATRPDSRRRPSMLQAVDVRIVSGNTCEKWHWKRGIKVRASFNLTLTSNQQYFSS